MTNLFGRRSPGLPAHTVAVKAWITDALRLPPDVSIMVTELQCHEPGCPPIETVIALLSPGAPTRQYKLHCALADVTRDDVARILTA